jgi:hypothetical protein
MSVAGASADDGGLANDEAGGLDGGKDGALAGRCVGG